nr:MAG TPA: phosphatase A [Caudoviricetes sp.]
MIFYYIYENRVFDHFFVHPLVWYCLMMFDDVYRSDFHISHIRNKTPPQSKDTPLPSIYNTCDTPCRKLRI